MKVRELLELVTDAALMVPGDSINIEVFVESGFKAYTIDSVACAVQEESNDHVVVIRVGDKK